MRFVGLSSYFIPVLWRTALSSGESIPFSLLVCSLPPTSHSTPRTSPSLVSKFLRPVINVPIPTRGQRRQAAEFSFSRAHRVNWQQAVVWPFYCRYSPHVQRHQGSQEVVCMSTPSLTPSFAASRGFVTSRMVSLRGECRGFSDAVSSAFAHARMEKSSRIRVEE